ncbi:hypothetical protein LXL04_006852 [Taraxacum kok-saghyz]
MAPAPMSDEGSSDLQLTKNDLKTPYSLEAYVTIAQLPRSETPNSLEAGVTIAQLPPSEASPPPAPFTPSTKSSGKRKRLTPSKYEIPFHNAEKKRSLLKHKAIRDPSKTCLKSDQISPTMIRAGEIQSSLGAHHPTFKKVMVKSHVVSCFWMGIPVPFSRSYLPIQDTLMVIEDENGQQCNVKYIRHKHGLSAGWRRFAIVHKLVEGDALVFQLVESSKFKVYIVRANESKQVDGVDHDLLNHNERNKLKARAKMAYIRSEPLKQSSMLKVNANPKGGPPNPYAEGGPPKQNVEGGPPKENVEGGPPKQNVEGGPPKQNVEGGPPKQNMEGGPPKAKRGPSKEAEGGPPKPNRPLQDLKAFKHFRIMVNNQCIDLELSDEIRTNYFKLCTARKQIIHDDLAKGLYYKLVAGMIGETVNIANAIKNCKPTTPKEEFETWDSSLKSFQLMGMKVGFLRDRIRTLQKLTFESEDAKKYAEAKEEKTRNEEMMKVLEATIADLKESNRKIDGILSAFEEKVEMFEVVFQEKVNEPW